ncbi:hypothetical protein CKM354_000020100 [Cercospora kikuchii]|uniref:Uncharacterized protein n=1 Tax=Cercospora kikuchii TaxID=84275 RepID=A0A9P3FBD6_9PEZI|nr:uncharacterized protein CKM354_000020100 [Cercospora kikuchii]GIZ36734.1 hypothetical protein CKM354_000020100 [Cercospora kikuchii]
MSTSQHRTSGAIPVTDPVPAAFFIFDCPFPAQCQDDECLVEVSFDFPDSTPTPWPTLGFLIPLAADVYTLSQGVKNACDNAIARKWRFLNDLYAFGKDIKGVARICMPDGSDIFANRTRTGRIRIESVSDLFTNAERRDGDCVVSVRVVLSVIEMTDRLAAQPTGPPLEMERTHSLKLLKMAANSTHRNMESVVLQSLATVHRIGQLRHGVLTRRINALWIGSVDHTSRDKGVEVLETAVVPLEINQLPELPTLTFNDYSNSSNAGLSDVLKQSGSRIELAVRLVNRLSGPFSGPVREDGRLPGNVIVSVKHGEKQKNLICKALEEALRDFGARPENASTIASVLFHEDFRPKCEFQLWILPQAARPKKLFRFDGGLVKFLDMAMVLEGNTRMYMEAHIVPTRE